jgi:hypothetical protein
VTPKYNTNIKNVLDDAFTYFAIREAPLKIEIRGQGKLLFNHKMEFPYVKQPTKSAMEAYYAILHMLGFIRDQYQLMLTTSLLKWGQDLANASDDDLKHEFYSI